MKRERMDIGAPGKNGTPELASLIREARLRMDMSQLDLALKTGVSRSLVNEIEHMRSPLTHEDTVRAFAEVLDLKESDIYAASGTIPPDIIRAIRSMSGDEIDELRERVGYMLRI